MSSSTTRTAGPRREPSELCPFETCPFDLGGREDPDIESTLIRRSLFQVVPRPCTQVSGRFWQDVITAGHLDSPRRPISSRWGSAAPTEAFEKCP